MNSKSYKYNGIFIIWLSFIFHSFQLSAQNPQEISASLNWEEIESDESEPARLYFDDCTYLAGNHVAFLAYEQWIPLSGNVENVEAELSGFTIETLDKKFLTFDERQDYKSDFELNSEVKFTKKGIYLHITLIPIRKLNSNSFERLTDFTLNLNYSFSSSNRRSNRGGGTTAENSVLSEGLWYKVAIGRDGVYRLNYSDLEDLGVEMSNVNPANINLYGNGGTLLPFDNTEFFYDDLQKNAIEIVGDEDGVFNTNDYLLFYGKGPDKWEQEDDHFVHTKHYYSDSAYYYIRVDDAEPKRIQPFNQSSATADVVVTKFDDYRFIENNNTNLAHSGREFFGEYFGFNSSLNFNFDFPNMTDDSVLIEGNIVSRSVGGESDFDVLMNGQTFNMEIDQTYTSVTSPVAKMKSFSFDADPSGQNVGINVSHNSFNASSEAWLDYLRVNAKRDLVMNSTQMQFRSLASVGPGNVSEFILASANLVSNIWDITDITNVSALNPNPGADEISFKVETDDLRQFIALANVNFLTPRLVGAVSNQNLHAMVGTDMIIVSTPLYLGPSEQLAELHRAEGLSVEVVTPQLIYNEFSSGNPDVSAIKKFMIHLYDSAPSTEERIRYLLLFGDASFSGNKGLLAANGSNVICFQSKNSLSPTNSYVSDDYFAFLDPIASESASDDLYIGVGRIPAKSVAEAESFVNKIRIYMGENTSSEVCSSLDNNTTYGPWRNIIAFVTDDRDGNSDTQELSHMNAAEEHADTIFTRYNDYNIEKIYMDQYQQFSTPGGERYPDGIDAIRNRIEDGALVVAYIGHGGERGWAHERILNTTTIQEFTNLYKLPVFFTATCELARFDNPEEISAGELLVHNPNGGAIAMLTTTRIVFSGGNRELGRAFYNIAFENENYEDLRLGDIATITKNTGPQSENTRNFTLLGDPALKMSYPKKQIFTSEINNVPIKGDLDTLRALQEVTIKGYVGELDGTILSDFNGFVYPTVYDKKALVETLNNDQTDADYSFEVFRNVLYKGKVSATNGEFEYTFIVPKDIDYVFDTARISYYGVDGSTDANGHTEEIVIGGIDASAEQNSVGPVINLFMNDSTFVDGGITDEDPLLFAKIFDENGVNTTGAGIGHDITAVLDGQTNDPFVLNNNYESDLDTYKSGEIKYQFSNLSEGSHTLRLKVWDVYNNSSESTTEFVVASSAELALDHVLNYPNPFTTRTEFSFEHNQVCEYLEVQVQVFTVSGKLVKTINELMITEGFRSEGIVWDGKDDFGDNIGKGVYVYRVKVKTPTGSKAEKFEKLVILK